MAMPVPISLTKRDFGIVELGKMINEDFCGIFLPSLGRAKPESLRSAQRLFVLESKSGTIVCVVQVPSVNIDRILMQM